MDEIQINGGDDFYEKIEAPKFVDLTSPDHHRPHNDDRYWFCLRVGCDQKHEEEMDSEAIYKNFVLRVMAARSPNVRLQKALYGKDPSSNVKCPLTVPAKSSKSRVSKLALVSSSISEKMVDDGKMKGRHLFKQRETPKKEKQSSAVVAKALTTPRNKKRLSNLGTFRSVRNQKTPALDVPKNRMVAKALVFHSPKKTVRVNLKKSTELSVGKLCTGIKKLEITSGKKDLLGSNKPVPVDSSRKRFRGREVKSRVYDSLRPLNCQGKEARSLKCLKKKNEINELQLHCVPTPCQDTENDSSDVEIEEKSRNGSLGKCSTSGTSESEKGNEHEESLETQKNLEFQLGENKGEAASDTLISKEQVKAESPENVIMPNAIETDENENASVSDDKENKGELMNLDDKENASASNNNRKLHPSTSHMEKKKINGKLHLEMMQVTKGMTKTPKGNSAAAVNCPEGVSYRKPKLTNPKPFRLRTDERQILKEENLEKKLHREPLKDTMTKRIHSNAVQRNEKRIDQPEYDSDACEDSEKESGRTKNNQPQRRGTSCSCPQTSKAAAERKESTTPQASRREFSQEKVAKKSQERLKRTKSPCMKQIARTPGGTSCAQTSKAAAERKESTTPQASRREFSQEKVAKKSQEILKRTKSPCMKQIARTPGQAIRKHFLHSQHPATKASTSSTSRSSFLGRKPVTIPKEPHFHNVHVPKNCTRRVASEGTEYRSRDESRCA